VAVLLYAGVAAFVRPVEGSYVVQTMNGHALPAELKMPTTEGDYRLFRLEQAVLTLKPGGRFTPYVRYYHQLVQRGTRPTATPVLSESETGTYKAERNNLLLIPTTKTSSRTHGPFAATIVGEEIRESYALMNGTVRYQLTLVLRRNPNFWLGQPPAQSLTRIYAARYSGQIQLRPHAHQA
jgi:hypothetical protein